MLNLMLNITVQFTVSYDATGTTMIVSMREIKKESVARLPLLANFAIYMFFFVFLQPRKFAMVNMAAFPTIHLLITRLSLFHQTLKRLAQSLFYILASTPYKKKSWIPTKTDQ